MAINITFAFDNADEAIDFLAKTSGEYTPVDKPVRHETPWKDAEPSGSQGQAETSAEADPWADQATTSKPAKHEHKSANGRFPATGEHTKESPNGDRTWTFGLPHAPDCDCGYTAAKFAGVTNGKKWAFFKCPLGFGEGWRDKCSFSESTK